MDQLILESRFSGSRVYMEQRDRSKSPVPEMLNVTNVIGGYILNETKLYEKRIDEILRVTCVDEDMTFSVPDKLWIKVFDTDTWSEKVCYSIHNYILCIYKKGFIEGLCQWSRQFFLLVCKTKFR